MTEDEKIQLLADLVLWLANCPIKLKPDTVNGILSEIQLQKWHEKMDKYLNSTNVPSSNADKK